jgi:hypothetical protein
MILQHSVYYWIPKDSYMCWLWMVAINTPYIKEIKDAIFTTEDCSFRSQIVYFCSTVYFFSTVYCTVWDVTLEISAIMLPFYFPLLTAWWWLCLLAENVAVFWHPLMCVVVLDCLFIYCNTGTQLGLIDKELFNSCVRVRLIALSKVLFENLVWFKLTQPVTEKSTRNISLGVNAASA